MKTHKAMQNTKTYCGRWLTFNSMWRFNWSGVTCKSCLRNKPLAKRCTCELQNLCVNLYRDDCPIHGLKPLAKPKRGSK